ncbi:MAG TPA: s-methyl-5-thioribose-1-phosphate isomerase, partial [Planctomycetota bacterium]|nr:s-methyl-5-thioribose-1-phosphate isomerase [Planctomycetota bacterium]
SGTALAVVYAAREAGLEVGVFADETRPLLQGARLTSWELGRAGVHVTLICDSAAASVIGSGRVHCVIVGADRIASNGDVANKIGTYGVAVLAREHGVPFYVAAPTTTFDLKLRSGKEIPIEERAAGEVVEGFGRRTAPRGVEVFNPAFDVTPARFVTAIITETGVIRPPYSRNLRRALEESGRRGARRRQGGRAARASQPQEGLSHPRRSGVGSGPQTAPGGARGAPARKR